MSNREFMDFIFSLVVRVAGVAVFVVLLILIFGFVVFSASAVLQKLDTRIFDNQSEVATPQ